MRFGRKKKAPDPTAIRGELTTQRRVTGVYRDHRLDTVEDEVDHEIRAGQTRVRRVAARTGQRTQLASAKDQARLAAMFSRATVQGSGARLRAQMESSGEIRALRIASAGRWSLYLGIPILLAFGAWSTTGVHEGVVILLDLAAGSATWAAAWAVEPAIISIVAGLLIFSAIMRRNGGEVDWRIKAAEIGGLGTSLLLNAVGPIAVATGFWSCLGDLVPHSIGPGGAALTAWLLGVCDEHVSRARPWDGAPSITEMDLRMPDLTAITNPFQIDAAARPAVRAQATRDDGGQGDEVTEDMVIAAAPPAPVSESRPSRSLADIEDLARSALDWDTPVSQVPVTPDGPAGPPDVLTEAVPDTIPDWMTTPSPADVDPPPAGGGVGTLDRPAGPTPAEVADDLAAFLAGLEAAETPEVTRARAEAYTAAQQTLAAGETRIAAARRYIEVMESRGQEWTPTEAARAAGLASRAQLYRPPRRPDQDDETTD